MRWASFLRSACDVFYINRSAKAKEGGAAERCRNNGGKTGGSVQERFLRLRLKRKDNTLNLQVDSHYEHTFVIVSTAAAEGRFHAAASAETLSGSEILTLPCKTHIRAVLHLSVSYCQRSERAFPETG